MLHFPDDSPCTVLVLSILYSVLVPRKWSAPGLVDPTVVLVDPDIGHYAVVESF